MSEDNKNKKNNFDNSNKMCDNVKYDNNRVNSAGTTYDIVLSVKTSDKMNNISYKKTAKGKVQMPYKLHDGELSKNDFETIRKANWDNIKEKFGIDLSKANNSKTTTKMREFPPKIQVGKHIKQSENHVKPVLDINNNDIKKDLEILNRFNRYNLLKNFGIDLAQAKSNKVTTQTEAFPAKNSINVQNKDNDFKEDKNNSSEKALPEQNAVLFFNKSVIKQIENQNNNSFVADDFFDKECHFEINKAEQLNILSQGTSDFNFKSTDPKNTLRYLKIIKWLSGIFGCGILISLIVLWQFFNPLLTAVFLVGSAIDITIFVVAWRACSYLNNSVHELNKFPHLSNNKNVSIKINKNNQERNKNQPLIPSSDKNNKNNNLTGQK